MIKTMMKPVILTSAVAAALASTQVLALEAGDMLFRAGITTVQPNDDSSNPTLGGANLGGSVTVDSDTQLGLTFEYMVSKSLGIEVLAASPFTHTVSAKGGTLSSLGLKDIADVTHLPPTVSLNYHFNDGAAFQPYVGLGVNYTVFFDEDASKELESAAGKTDVELDNSFGVAAQAGFDYFINDNWLVNASVRYIDIETSADVKTTALGTVKVDVDIDPYVYSLFLGYKF